MYSLGKSCGKYADRLFMSFGRLSTKRYFVYNLGFLSRVKTLYCTHFIQLFFTQVSTTTTRPFSPVKVPAFPTFHRAYNYHYEVIYKER